MEDKQLGELLELTRENNKILRGIQRSARVNKVFKFIYWGLIIGSFVGTYYYIQPYFNLLLNLYSQAGSTLSDIQKKASSIPDLSKTPGAVDILKQLDSLNQR
ncbi:MAG: hypothetical protein Q7S19_00230 [bacterium]|nr:hypothetical protein [bacterium]